MASDHGVPVWLNHSPTDFFKYELGDEHLFGDPGEPGRWYTEEEAAELEGCRDAIHALGIGTKRPPEEVFEHFRRLHGLTPLAPSPTPGGRA